MSCAVEKSYMDKKTISRLFVYVFTVPYQFSRFLIFFLSLSFLERISQQPHSKAPKNLFFLQFLFLFYTTVTFYLRFLSRLYDIYLASKSHLTNRKLYSSVNIFFKKGEEKWKIMYVFNFGNTVFFQVRDLSYDSNNMIVSSITS